MGVVYRVFDTYVEREVAQKRLSLPEARMRARVTALFENEYDTLSQLVHPGIVEVYEYGVDADGPYYTMELLAGGDLTRALPLSLFETCRIVRAVVSALALVHARGLVYRDLSPSNVRLTSDGQAKLIDFGALTPFGVPKEVVGTVAFMAPECLRKAPLDVRTDLYAVGALLYWCLTSAHAVQARSIAELPNALSYPVRAPSELRPEIPKALDELVLALLHHDPLARPNSAAEVMHRLTAIGQLAPEEHTERVAVSYLTRPPLVGREEQLELLINKFEQTCGGRGRALLLSAVQGLGRSALVAQLTRHAQLAGAAVLRAEVSAQCGPFAVLRPLLRGALLLDASLAEAYPLVVQLCSLQDSAASAPRSASEAAEREARLSASARDCLLELSRRLPTVIVIDDVQRADAESLGLLVSLAAEAPKLSLLVVATSARDESPSHAHAHEKLIEVSEMVALTPLEAEHLATLTASIFGAAPNSRRLAMWLHRHGGGNPARCMTLARRLLARGAIEYVTGIFSLPYDIADDAIEQSGESDVSLERLSPAARKAAELLSIFDEAASLEELAASAEQSTKELVLALDELTKLGVARRMDGRFSFADNALRALVTQAADGEHLRALHLRAAQVLCAIPGASVDVRRRASHHLLAGQASDQGLQALRALAPELARAPDALGKAVPTLEAALSLHARRGDREDECMPLLVPLALAGYYRDPKLLGPYIARSLESLLRITGTKLALRLRRFLGGKLAFAIGLLYARIYYRFAKHLRDIPFMDIFSALFGVAGTGAAASCAAFDFAFAHRMGEALEPYAGLGPRHPANIVREYCLTTARSRIGPLAVAEARFEQLMARLSDPRTARKLDDEVRAQLMVGALYAGGMVKLLRPNTDGLLIADKMDAQGRTFYHPHAELLRMLHYAMRGEQHLAEPHRERTELLSLLGGAGWSAVNNTAHRSILVYQWTQDSLNLLRVIADLKRFRDVNAAVEPHLQLAEAYVELMRGRADLAVPLYEQVFARFPTPCFWTWIGERGRYAEALNSLGKHAQARDICSDALNALAAEDRAYPFLSHVVEQQHALAEAQLGRADAAAARLEALLAQVEESQNPLLIGSLHRDRAYVALIARDGTAFERHVGAMARWFRGTKNPALIQQCERCGNAGLKAGLPPPWIDTMQLLDPFFARTASNDASANDDCTAFMSEAELSPRGGTHGS
jgi:Protein kinase domain/AAA ATPase domain